MTARWPAMLVLAGCGLDVGPAGAWVPVEQVAAPLALESNPATPVNTFRTDHPVRTDPLRVVSYNIDLELPDVDPLAVAAAIEDDPALASAGLFLFQEGEAYPGEATSRVKPIADRLGLAYVYVPARTKDGSDAHTDGLAILSAFPIESAERMQLPDIGSSEHRIALAADIAIGGRSLHVIDVHLLLKANAEERIAQLRPSVLDAPEATLVAGDFNMSWVQWSPAGVPVLSGTSATDQAEAVTSYMHALRFAAPSADSGPTAHALGLTARVDAVFSRGLAVTFGAVEHVGPSDHWPIWVDVRLPP